MTIDQLRERVEATCNKNGIFDLNKIDLKILGESNYLFLLIEFQSNYMIKTMPNTDLLLEAVDLECRAIKARQGIATNGIYL